MKNKKQIIIANLIVLVCLVGVLAIYSTIFQNETEPITGEEMTDSNATKIVKAIKPIGSFKDD